MKDRLKNLRIALDLTQGEFGRKMGMSDVAVSHMESGRNAINNQNINLICLTFGVNEAWLRDGIGKMFIEPPKKPENPKEHQLLDLFRKLVPEMQDIVLKKVKELLDSIEKSWVPPSVDAEKGEQKGA